MGTETVVYRTDNRAIEEMRKQREQDQQNYKAMFDSQQQMINKLSSENERKEKEREKERLQEKKEREKENKQRDEEYAKLMNQFVTMQQKQEENRQKEVQLITQSNIENQRQIAAILKDNRENYLRLFNSQKSDELNQYKEEIKKLKQRMKEAQEHKEQFEKQREKEYIELQNSLNEKIKNAKDEVERQYFENKKREEQEKRKKEEQAFQEFESLRQKYIEKEYERIMKAFQSNELNFCKNEIESFEENTIKQFINDVLNNEDVYSIVLDNLKSDIKEIISKKSSVVNHLNILLLGPSGVGKSTLINAIYKEEICKTGKGKPCTQGEPKYYISNNSEGSEQFIRLADSRGIEKGEYGVNQVLESARNFIQFYLNNNNPDQFVHLIWYCITGTRFEDIEKQSLIELAKLYTDNNLPIIVVYTHTVNEEQMLAIKEEIKNMEIKAYFIDILAKDITGKNTIKAYGVDELIKISIEKAKNAISSSCNTALRANCRNNVTNIILAKGENISHSIANKIENDIREINIGTEIGKLSDIIGETILFIFLEYLNIKSKGLKKSSEDIISDFVKNYFEKILKIYKNKLIEIIQNESQNIANNILELQIQVNQRNNGNLNINQQLDKSAIFQNEYDNLLNAMKDLAELFCIKNAIRFIWIPIYKILESLLSIKYKDCIDNNGELKEIFERYAQETFNNIGNNLKNL